MAMQKAHSSIPWVDYPKLDTPLNAQNLLKEDKSIDVIDDRVISLDTTKFDKTEAQGLFKDVELDPKTGIITFTTYSGAKKTIDTLLEKIAINFDFDEVTQKITITLEDGTTKEVDLKSFITEYEFLDSETIAFTVDAAGKVTAIVKEGSIQEKHLRPDYLADIRVESAKAEAARTGAETAQAEAQKSQTAAATSATQSATSAKESADSATAAAGSASTATAQATSASNSAQAAKTSETNAATSATNAASSAATATSQATSASNSASTATAQADIATKKAKETFDYATKAQSYTEGGTGTRENEDIDNAKNYYEESKKIYDSFVSTGNVTGVKGGAETDYRHGNVNITKDNLGLGKVENLSRAEIDTQGINLIANTGTPTEIIPRNTGNSADNYNFAGFYFTIGTLQKGSVYTVSADIKITKGTFSSVSIALYNQITAQLQSELRNPTIENGHIITDILVTGNEATELLIYAGTAGSTRDQGIIISNLKLEQGSVEDPHWTPAPEDVVVRSELPTSLPANGGTADTISTTLPILKGGTGATTANGAANNILIGTDPGTNPLNGWSLTDVDRMVFEGSSGGAVNSKFYRTPMTKVFDYLNAKTFNNAKNSDTVDGKHASDLQNYNNLTNRPTIPAAANNGTLTIQRNGSTIATFTANSSTNVTANIQDTDTNTDVNVTQTLTTANANYPLLLSSTTTTGTRGALFDSGVTLNPSTNVIEANVSGSAGSVAWANVSGRPTIPTVVNVLTSTSTTDALSAAQGKALNDSLGTVRSTANTASTNASNALKRATLIKSGWAKLPMTVNLTDANGRTLFGFLIQSAHGYDEYVNGFVTIDNGLGMTHPIPALAGGWMGSMPVTVALTSTNATVSYGTATGWNLAGTDPTHKFNYIYGQAVYL